MTTPDLPTFLTQRYDEQEAVARAASPGGWDGTTPLIRGRGAAAAASTVNCDRPQATATHIATHDPAYVLADLAAKRQVVAAVGRLGGYYEPDAGRIARGILKALAQPFADHPDFRPEWKL